MNEKTQSVIVIGAGRYVPGDLRVFVGEPGAPLMELVDADYEPATQLVLGRRQGKGERKRMKRHRYGSGHPF